MLDRRENAVHDEKEDGQDGELQCKQSLILARIRRSPGSTGEPSEGYSWDDVSFWARCLRQRDRDEHTRINGTLIYNGLVV